jgi:mRNA interferase RelE/StbE
VAKYKIVFAPTAEKQLFKLPQPTRVRLAHAISKLVLDPYLGKPLKGELREYRSYRVGDYRVIYFIRNRKIQIEIIRVVHRREVYR